MSTSEAKNLEAISAAIDQHNRTCPFPAAEVRMNPYEVERLGWEEIRGLPIVPDPEIANTPDVQQRLQRALDRVNADVSILEKVRRFIIAPEAFTIDNEQMTPSMKIRRHVIGKVYGEQLDALYKR